MDTKLADLKSLFKASIQTNETTNNTKIPIPIAKDLSAFADLTINGQTPKVSVRLKSLMTLLKERNATITVTPSAPTGPPGAGVQIAHAWEIIRLPIASTPDPLQRKKNLGTQFPL